MPGTAPAPLPSCLARSQLMLDFLREYKHNGEKLLIRWGLQNTSRGRGQGRQCPFGQPFLPHGKPSCALRKPP